MSEQKWLNRQGRFRGDLVSAERRKPMDGSNGESWVAYDFEFMATEEWKRDELGALAWHALKLPEQVKGSVLVTGKTGDPIKEIRAMLREAIGLEVPVAADEQDECAVTNTDCQVQVTAEMVNGYENYRFKRIYPYDADVKTSDRKLLKLTRKAA